jgi:dTMP kinase
MIVLADRYVYTAFARDVVRGVHPQWVRNVYGFAVRPDIGFYFRVSPELSLTRILSARAKLKYHEAGMDLGITDDIHESFRTFQGRIVDEYERIAEEYRLVVMDGTRPIREQQNAMRKIVTAGLKDYRPAPFLRKKENIYVS